MDESEAGIAALCGRWMVGGEAIGACPPGWRDLVEGDPAPELALLAIAGQAVQLLLRPVPPAALAQARPIPPLALPTLPEALRAPFRRLVSNRSGPGPVPILALMAARGRSAHPADWMPRAGDEGLPGLYAPWLGYQAGAAPAAEFEDLTAANWDDWLPSARVAALAGLRRRDPAAALALVEARASTEPAERRVRLVEVLQDGLSEADAAFLQTLHADRSARLRSLAARLLARLGHPAEEAEAAAELGGFFERQRAAILSRREVVAPIRLKTGAQRARRAELMGSVTLAGLAGALELSPAALVAEWDFADPQADEGLIAMAAASASDDCILALLERLLDLAQPRPAALTPLFERLGPEARRKTLPPVLAADNETFTASLACVGSAYGGVALDALLMAPALDRLEGLASAEARGERSQDMVLDTGLTNLGLLADATAARALLARFVEAGLAAADPMLAMLAFNAALEGSENP